MQNHGTGTQMQLRKEKHENHLQK